jgi:hypothetical protein
MAWLLWHIKSEQVWGVDYDYANAIMQERRNSFLIFCVLLDPSGASLHSLDIITSTIKEGQHIVIHEGVLRTKNIHLPYLSNSPNTTKVAWEWLVKSHQEMCHHGQWKFMVSMAKRMY